MILYLSLLAFVIASLAFPVALRFALKYNIVDNPNARKLQKEPVPVFGGIVVMIGILIPLLIAAYFYHYVDLSYILCSIVLLWCIGVTDDIRGLSAAFRFIVEIGLVWVLIWQPMQSENGPMLDHLHGLFGRGLLSYYSAIPLTIIGSVGIINAINLIDGVDGYSSGFGIVSNTLFAFIFTALGQESMAIFSAIAAAALVPFYIHNVFGRKSKMFIGDGGSLIIGLILAYDTQTLLSSKTNTMAWEEHEVGIVALALAILAIPIFDTLRVMFARILHGQSPFSPDKTHVHHAFISLGFSHVATSTLIILINFSIVGLWYVCYRLGGSITTQFLMVVCLGLLATCGLYYGMRHLEKAQGRSYRKVHKQAKRTQVESKSFWHRIEVLVDKTALK